MISDAYTREYDERQDIELVKSVAARFGCRAETIREYRHVRMNVYMPNGRIFHQFESLDDAKSWAEKWKPKD